MFVRNQPLSSVPLVVEEVIFAVWLHPCLLFPPQMDGGLSGRGVAPDNGARGGAEKWRLSGQTGQLLCPADGFPQEDLRS